MKRNLDSEGVVVLFELNALEAPKEIENFLFQQMCLDASENSPCFSFSKEKYSILEYKIKNMLSLYEEKSEIAKLSLRNEVQSFLIECMKEAEDQKKPIVSIEYFTTFKHVLNLFLGFMRKNENLTIKYGELRKEEFKEIEVFYGDNGIVARAKKI